MNIEPYTIRSATSEEAAIISGQRRAMFSDMGYADPRALEAMAARFLPWLQTRMQNGEYMAWFALAPDETVAAGLGLWRMDWPPHMVGPGAPRGNILNVYTDPRHRRRGLARRLMHEALDWCRENGIRAVILHASDEGRGLYQSMGFRPTNEMRLILEE